MFVHRCETCPLKTAHKQYAMITGASQGLGKAFAEECGRMGFNLVLVALPGSGLPDVALDLSNQFGVDVEYMELDLTVHGSPEVIVDWVERNRWPVAWLINNAGVGYNARFEDSTLQENETCILLNNLALVKLTHRMLPVLKRHPRPYILNVASLAAFFPMPFMPVYAPSKAFTVNFSLALRQEVRDSHVQVSVLCPNGIRTNLENREKIDSGGLVARLTCMNADEVASYAIRKMLAGQPVIIPGWINRCVAGASRFIPSSLINAVISAFWGKTARAPAQNGLPEPVLQVK